MYISWDKILDTGGGVLNAIKYFSDKPFLIINPDTIWNYSYLKELKSMEKMFFKNKNNKCLLLVVNKNKSFDQSLKGDFSLVKDIIEKKNKNNLNYIYTGLQIMHPNIFSEFNEKIFSMNKIWDSLIRENFLKGMESKIVFLHVTILTMYQRLLNKI